MSSDLSQSPGETLSTQHSARSTSVVALIGLTHPHSAMYLTSLETLDEVGGIVLYDSDPAALAAIAAKARKLVGTYDDLAPLLAREDVTHVLVAVPNDQSVPILVRAIEAGKHIFTEKPAARSAAEFAPVLAALERNPVTFAVAYMNRWHPGLRRMRDLYQEGAIGRLLAVELRMVTTQVRFRDPSHWLFRHEIAGGGIVAWLGCHWLDMARYLSGEEVTSVTALLASTNDEAITVEDTAAIGFRLSGGGVGSLHAGYLLASGALGYEGTSYDMAVHLRGTQGTLAYTRGTVGEAVMLESVTPEWRERSPYAVPYSMPSAPGYGGAHGLEFFRAFLAAGPGDPVPAGLTDAQRVLEILDAVYAYGAEGRAVEVKRWEAS
jgi:UDP-N-acetyl-2-amino-2-deoxyglucuronate dehydrogenase